MLRKLTLAAWRVPHHFINRSRFVPFLKRSIFPCTTSHIEPVCSRFISTGKVNFLKEIRYSETENETVIEGISVKSPREGNVIKLPGESTDACPLCKLGLKNLRHTDVLIIGQFLQTDGTVVPQHVSGLCTKQQNIVKRLIKQAQKAGLLPARIDEPPLDPWDRFNKYFKK